MERETAPEAAAGTRIALGGVPETLLWPLFNRAHDAKRANPILNDSMALSIAERIDYPYEKSFGRADEGAPLRALGFDQEIRRYLVGHPEATVVSLGDGLETMFWRVDNGRIKWISVDLPETIALRKKFLPEHPRLTQLECSALDHRWMDGVDPSQGVFVAAQGLLMYFKPDEVHALLSACSRRFPDGAMMFDTAPRWVSKMTLSGKGWKKTRDYRVPAMPWGIDVREIPALAKISAAIAGVNEVRLARGRTFVFKYVVPVVTRLPLIRQLLPAMVLMRFRKSP